MIVSNTISNPVLLIKTGKPVPTIEVDNDAIVGTYANGTWEELVAPFTAQWVKEQTFAKSATIWMWGSLSISFNHPGYSIFIAQFGLPMSFFKALKLHLSSELPSDVRFSDYVQVSWDEGWRARIHVQGSEVWTPMDAIEWNRVST